MPDKSLGPSLVIFDCDGVLVDSEPVSNRVIHAFLTERGARFSLGECSALFTGKSMSDVEEYMTANGVALANDWTDQCYALTYAALEKELTPMQGVRATLQKLRDNKVAFCVASNGRAAKMNVTLGTTGMLHWFKGNMFSACDVGQSKPAPDVFLAAARANGVDPQDCVVVEDSPTGMLAARNAGMKCYAFVADGQVAPANLSGAQVFADMGDLPALLGIA
jgi:HAD superfamily hydrolase (TIGR01509 family)